MDPFPRIQAKAVCVFRRGDRILVAYGVDSVKRERYARPLGGSVEFGERAVDALRREIREEVGAEIRAPRPLGVLENLFTLEGRPGHEVLFVFDAELADPSLECVDGIPVREAGWDGPAEWVALDRFRAGECLLYPDGLLSLLDASRQTE